MAGMLFGLIADYALLPVLISLERVRAFGALLGWKLQLDNMFWFPGAVGAALGVIGGVIVGAIFESRKTRRIESIRQAAGSLGARFSPSSDPELSDSLSRDFPQIDPGMHNVVRTEVQGIRIAVGDVTITRETGSGIESTTSSVTQTAAYCDSKTLRIPRFTLQPESLMTKMFSRVTGIKDINFPDHPEFSRAYYLSAADAENTRKLFNGRLLDALGRRPGLYIASAPTSLIIYWPGKLCDAGELKGFISEAAEIFRLFEESARQSNLTAEAVSNAKEDIRARTGEVPGLIGEILRKNLVSRADVDAFFSQPPPRKIPPNLLAYRNRETSLMLIGVGIVFALGGALLILVPGYLTLSAGKGLLDIGLGSALFGLLFFVIGAVITFFSVPAYFRLTRLLRHGRPVTARIEKIASTSWTVNGEEIFRVTARYHAGGRAMQGTCKITGSALKRAQKLAPDTKSVLILHDPANPQRILLVEELQNEKEAERFTR